MRKNEKRRFRRFSFFHQRGERNAAATTAIKHITLYDLYDCRINRLPPRETAAS